jgi:hypothetical protein
MLMVLVLLSFDKLFAQENPSEIEIKRSGKFYWGQAYDADSIKACLDARDDLMYKISSEISGTNKLISNSDVIVKCIKYVIKPVEELSKVIAFVYKDDVRNIAENKSVLCIHELKYTEQEKTKKNSALDNGQIINPSKTEPNHDHGMKNNPTTNKSELPVLTSLLERLKKCNTAEQLMTLLKKESQNNKLIYSWDSELYRKKVSSENFYIVLIDPIDHHIIAFLDKGLLQRKDLKNGGQVLIESDINKWIQVWIQIM